MSLLDYSDTSIAGVIIIGGMSFAFLSVLSLCSLLVWCRWWGEEGILAGTRRRSNNSLVIVRIRMMRMNVIYTMMNRMRILRMMKEKVNAITGR